MAGLAKHGLNDYDEVETGDDPEPDEGILLSDSVSHSDSVLDLVLIDCWLTFVYSQTRTSECDSSSNVMTIPHTP